MAQAIDEIVVKITKSAQEQIKYIINAKNDTTLRLRIYTKPGGCSGLEYAMSLGHKAEGDYEVLVNDIGVIIDSTTFPHVNGITLNYEVDLLASGFKIDNPNAVKTCGCGTSFRTEDDKGKMEKC